MRGKITTVVSQYTYIFNNALTILRASLSLLRRAQVSLRYLTHFPGVIRTRVLSEREKEMPDFRSRQTEITTDRALLAKSRQNHRHEELYSASYSRRDFPRDTSIPHKARPETRRSPDRLQNISRHTALCRFV